MDTVPINSVTCSRRARRMMKKRSTRRNHQDHSEKVPIELIDLVNGSKVEESRIEEGRAINEIMNAMVSENNHVIEDHSKDLGMVGKLSNAIEAEPYSAHNLEFTYAQSEKVRKDPRSRVSSQKFRNSIIDLEHSLFNAWTPTDTFEIENDYKKGNILPDFITILHGHPKTEKTILHRKGLKDTPGRIIGIEFLPLVGQSVPASWTENNMDTTTIASGSLPEPQIKHDFPSESVQNMDGTDPADLVPSSLRSASQETTRTLVSEQHQCKETSATAVEHLHNVSDICDAACCIYATEDQEYVLIDDDISVQHFDTEREFDNEKEKLDRTDILSPTLDCNSKYDDSVGQNYESEEPTFDAEAYTTVSSLSLSDESAVIALEQTAFDSMNAQMHYLVEQNLEMNRRNFREMDRRLEAEILLSNQAKASAKLTGGLKSLLVDMNVNEKATAKLRNLSSTGSGVDSELWIDFGFFATCQPCNVIRRSILDYDDDEISKWTRQLINGTWCAKSTLETTIP